MKHFAPVDISVIVTNWNRRDLLAACLSSLCRQVMDGTTYEVIVVDNGSHDGSAEMVEQRFLGQVNVRIRLIRNAQNRGFCEANNQGIAAAHGSYLALLNNDAEAAAGWLMALRRAFDANPHIGMAASKILVHADRQKIDKVGHLIYPDGLSRGRGCGEIDRGQYGPGETLWPDGCAAMYRKAMLDEIGLFDEDFFAYSDDAELGLRARIAGWTCRYVPAAIVFHHGSSTLGRASHRRLTLIERNRVLLAIKLFPWSLLCLNPVFYAARLLAGFRAAALNRGEVSRFRGVGGKIAVCAALIRGDIEALLMLPRMFVKRRSLRSLRKLSSGQIRSLILNNRIALRALMEEAT